jgi:hypothetical protein
MRDQEVLRANRELTAYFKGLRTEREARAALKIIKAYVRSRERQDPRQRTPLPAARRAAPTRAVKPTRRVRRRPKPASPEHVSPDTQPVEPGREHESD